MRHYYATLFVAVFAMSMAAMACTTCNFDFDTCHGAQGSSGNLCRLACICGSPTTASADLRHPGFFLSQKAGHFVVEAVLPGSPAARAGIRPGQIIVTLRMGGRKGCVDEWGRQATVELEDSGVLRTVSLVNRPINMLIADYFTATRQVRMVSARRHVGDVRSELFLARKLAVQSELDSKTLTASLR